MNEEGKQVVSWLIAQSPVSFGLTTEGDLQIEYGLSTGLPGAADVRMGLVIPAAELESLRRGLEATETIRETLSAKPSGSGPH